MFWNIRMVCATYVTYVCLKLWVTSFPVSVLVQLRLIVSAIGRQHGIGLTLVELVGFCIPLNTQKVILEKSFQAIHCTGTDNQIQRKKGKTRNQMHRDYGHAKTAGNCSAYFFLEAAWSPTWCLKNIEICFDNCEKSHVEIRHYMMLPWWQHCLRYAKASSVGSNKLFSGH